MVVLSCAQNFVPKSFSLFVHMLLRRNDKIIKGAIIKCFAFS